MAKYTANDPDIKRMSDVDFVNYNYDLLKYDVEKYQEAADGKKTTSALINPEQLANMRASDVPRFIFLILLFGMLVLLLLFMLMYIFMTFRKGGDNRIKLEIMRKMFMYFFVLLVILVLMYIVYNKIVTDGTLIGFTIKGK